MMTMQRREFLSAAAGAAVAGWAMRPVSGGEKQSAVPAEEGAKAGARPLAVASANGLRACDRAIEAIREGSDPLDAVVSGVNLVEDDPSDQSVGLGGLPNEEGVVELDACVMHGPTHKAGAVASLRGIKNPSSVAALVMRRTDHVLLVGEGAVRFARAHGFQEEDLLTEASRQAWLRWKETHSDRDNWLPPSAEAAGAARIDSNATFTHGTISCMALTAAGDIAGCTSTSGLSWKIAGRVGDSPIIGAGLYVDNAIGACGSTGRGEANLQNLSSALVVEFMRDGLTPEEACVKMMQRIADRTEPRLRNEQGEPRFDLKLYALRKDGLFGGASMRGEAKMAVHDGQAARHVTIPGLFG